MSAPLYTEYEGEALGQTLLGQLKHFVDTFTSVNSRLIAADGDKEKAIEHFINSSDHKDAVRLRKAIETAQQKLKELAEKEVVTEQINEEERATLTATRDSLKTQIQASRAAIVKLLDTPMITNRESAEKALESIGNPVSGNRGRKPGAAGSSLPRARGTITIDGGNFQNRVVDSFSKAAPLLNADVKDMQLALATKAGVAHEDIKTIESPVTFNFQPNDNGPVYVIKFEPSGKAAKGNQTINEPPAPELSEAVNDEAVA